MADDERYPEIDLAALVVGGRMPRSKYDHHEKSLASRVRNHAARQAKRLAEWERRDAERRAEVLRRRAGKLTLCERVLRAMEPGEWYGLREIAELIGEPRRKVTPWLYAGRQRFGRGLFQKARNAAYTPAPRVERFRGRAFRTAVFVGAQRGRRTSA